MGTITDSDTGENYTPAHITPEWNEFWIDVSRWSGQTVTLRVMVFDYSGHWCNMGDHTRWIAVDDFYFVVPTIPEDVLKYAPNLWFDSEEQLYPTSPFFDDEDLSGEDNKNDYYALSFNQKVDNFTIYYHTVDTGEEIVYEYWFYYAYNDWVNKHYHDWETVYVFVDKATGNVTRVVGSAHVGGFINNMLENPQLEVGVHVGVLIEGGSHASCTDKYNDGTPDTTNTGAWGLQWGTVPSDYTGIKIPVVVGFIHPWNLITVWLTPWDQGERIEYNEAHYTLKEITSDFIGEFGGLERFDDPITPIYLVNPVPGGITTPIPIDGEPPTHPWTQTRYNNPYDIIPILDRFITGTVSGSDTISAIIVILSEEPYYTFADENGNFLLNNVPYGVHDVVVNLDGYAPYKQRFIHIENTTLGVDGILNIIPEEEAFRIEGTATDIEESIIPNATINAYDESGSNLFTTLTDENGTYLVTASAEHVYTVEAITDVGIAIVHNVSGVARSKNEDALKFIEDGKEDQANNMLNAEDNIMNAFINEVEAESGKKIKD
ncbi:MAG: carboxypeptidase regulatory-like domain-containing protein [Methanomicrobia archaeon]|nr:carboxypeptidase regulatory-like domain-containing protein [Methanomicrobia archaeon]